MRRLERNHVGVGPAMPSPGDPQAEPTIGKAINGGFDLLETKCNRCDWVSLASLVPLRTLRQPPETLVWMGLSAN